MEIAKALGISEFKNLARFDTLQAYYSIAGRDLERELVPLLESEKVGLLVWSPLAGGLLSGKSSRTTSKPADSRRTDFDFPLVDKERAWKILDVMAPIAKHRLQSRTCLARLAPGQTCGHLDHHRRQTLDQLQTTSRRSNSSSPPMRSRYSTR